jgi:hypothetical protein
MVDIERSPGQDLRIGPYILRVLAVRGDEVVIALLDPEKDCAGCGGQPAERRRCLACGAEALLCADCVPAWRCPWCVVHRG